ncbi:MAG TPA: hypothetical protein VG275_06170 [Solirubrobacteraceae bacterium]|jgi:hypothetical protein|nr:hypothetical protein [Solirubrobacteraceae bacterium]
MAESKRFLLRLDPDLFEALRRWADDDMRSINAQIEYLLADQARRAGRLRGRPRRRPVAEGEEPDDDGGSVPPPSSAGRGRRVSSRARGE